jgi:serine/threonine-protein kinase
MVDHDSPTHHPSDVVPIAPRSTSATRLLEGTSYRPIRQLGEGAMGEVWEAEHIALRRRVVVKLVRREHAWTDGFLDRLRLEGQALAAITPHPHIVGVNDLGETRDGRGFLVMELLTGRTLRDELAERGFFPIHEAVELGRQLLDGLSAAHRAGILHRDIKLENLFLCDGPRAGESTLKILDFGIAKVLSGDGDADAIGSAFPQQLTKQGTTLGTPRFMSPEQAQGSAVDQRTDLYSAAIVLYMLLAGRDPFHHHRGTFAVLSAQADEIPRPPSAVASQPIPAALDHAILRALSKRRDDRFASAEAFMAELERAVVPQIPASWAATEPLDLSMFHRPRAPGTPSSLALPSTAADEPTCVLVGAAGLLGAGTVSPARENDRALPEDRFTLYLIGVSLFVALIAGGVLWRILAWIPDIR